MTNPLADSDAYIEVGCVECDERTRLVCGFCDLVIAEWNTSRDTRVIPVASIGRAVVDHQHVD